MADKTIGELKRATSLDDDSLLIAEQQGEAVALRGSLFKQFVEDAADEQVGAAKQYAEDAKQSADEAKTAVGGIGNAVEDTKNNAQAAEDARRAIEDMIVEAATLATGTPASVTKELVDGVVKLEFGLPAGDKGDKGDPGNNIQSIERTSGTGAPGTTDTYTITLTDGSTSTFEVYNGADGNGAGDMTATVYDPNGKKTDIYKYVDDAVAAGGGGGGVAGVSSFNGREGAVTPQNGDYTAAMVGADASGSAASALSDAKAYTDGIIAAIPTPDVSGQIEEHNTDTAAHADIRAELATKTNRNLLDNWYFANPVNQRGQTEYTGAGYSIDRWTGANASVSIQNGVKVVSTAYTNNFFQRISDEVWNSFVGRKVTLSFLITDIEGEMVISAHNTVAGKITEAGLVSITIDIPEGVVDVNKFFGVGGDAGNSITILAAKLELGSVQTLAHQDENDNWVLNEIPDYNEELLKCCMSTADSSDTYANNYKTPAAIGAAPAVESGEHPGCYYREVAGVVEWVNPPLEVGQEYRTTERYRGKPVYVKLVDCGYFPNSTFKSVIYSDDTSCKAISVTGEGGIGSTVPSLNYGGSLESTLKTNATVTLWGNGNIIYVACGGNRDYLALCCTVKYYKSTD